MVGILSCVLILSFNKTGIPNADRIGYPVLARPSYVLGGRAMEIVYSHDAAKVRDAEKSFGVLSNCRVMLLLQ